MELIEANARCFVQDDAYLVILSHDDSIELTEGAQ
jgi:hypothetical protein